MGEKNGVSTIQNGKDLWSQEKNKMYIYTRNVGNEVFSVSVSEYVLFKSFL